mgnify:CR=1 FL=1
MNKRIFTDYVSTQLDMNDEAREVLRSVKGEVTDELYGKMCDSLVGFQEDLQLTIAGTCAMRCILGSTDTPT